MTLTEDRQVCCCFTGHRPDKLTESYASLRRRLRAEAEQAYADGIRVFITGMAMGIDLLAAAEVLEMQKSHMDVHLVCAYPYCGSTDTFREPWGHLAREAADVAELCVNVSDAYWKGCYQKRNRWMVDHSARVIAAYNGTEGGTGSTIRYAVEQGIRIQVLVLE